jgi:16S rRNA (adenine1518-N6/adenine1519-N6)-dimethyltransferase
VPDIAQIIAALPPLKDIIRTHELRAEKALGQNFILDLNITDKIVRAAQGASPSFSQLNVFEVGPGPGGLTRSILSANPNKLISIEFDPRAVAALQSLVAAADGKLELTQADALHTDFTRLSDAPRAIVANLPYNISTVLLLKWLRDIYDDANSFVSMTLMFQREVAERLVAQPGGKDYGRLSVMTQWICNARIAFDLPPEAFSPPPKVTSSIAVLTPKKRDGVQPHFSTMEKILALGFQQRRKMIRSSMKNYLPAIHAVGIDETLRVENLSVDDYVRIANEVERMEKNP